jgi:hypothetical protein
VSEMILTETFLFLIYDSEFLIGRKTSASRPTNLQPLMSTRTRTGNLLLYLLFNIYAHVMVNNHPFVHQFLHYYYSNFSPNLTALPVWSGCIFSAWEHMGHEIESRHGVSWSRSYDFKFTTTTLVVVV